MTGNLSSLFAAWPFASSWMLLWGLAAVVPLLIHLWSRRKYDEIAWAAIDHLLAAVRKNARRLHIEQLLLLAVRTAILALFAMALADPVISSFPRLRGVSERTGRTHTLLVLDGSYSMDYRQADTSRFELAVRLAGDIVHQGRQGDAFTLVVMTDQPYAAIAAPAYDAEDVVTELQTLRRTDGGADLQASLAVIRDTLEQVRGLEPRLTRHRICFITDLGKTTWDVVNDDAVATAIAAIDSIAQLELINVGSPAVANTTVTDLTCTDSIPTLMNPTQLRVELENHGSEEVSGREISILVNGEKIWAQRVNIPARGRTSVTTQHTFRVPGEHGIEARLSHDRLLVDNHRWLSLQVREAIEVLCVEGKFGAARNLALALAPSPSTQSRIHVVTGSENVLLEEDLNRYDCVFLSNIGRFTPAEARLLIQYVQRGGGLVIFLGDQVQADNYNRLLGGQAGEPGLLGTTLDDFATTGDYRLDPLDYDHQLLKMFQGNEQAGLLTTPVWKYVRVTREASRATATVLAFRNGDPLITTCRRGQGRVILVTTAASGESLDHNTSPPTPWTAWPAWPSFPPLVQQMLEFAISGPQQSRAILVGDAVEGAIPLTETNTALTIEDPASNRHRVPAVTAQDRGHWAFTATQLSGFYQVRRDTDNALVQLLAVNLDTRESQLEPLDPTALPSQLQSRLPTAEMGDRPAEAQRPTHFFRHLLALVLGLLLTESFLAWFFGRSTHA